MKSSPKAADRMHFASKSLDAPNQHASNGHSELRTFECEIDIDQIIIERVKVPNMVVRPACPNTACTFSKSTSTAPFRMAIALYNYFVIVIRVRYGELNLWLENRVLIML